MSLITRCPACETLFRVVPDQLRMSQGWVRCGQCEDIFDASLHLQTVPEPVQPEPPPPPELLLPDPNPVEGWREAPADATDLGQGHTDLPGAGQPLALPPRAADVMPAGGIAHDEVPLSPDLGLIFPGDPVGTPAQAYAETPMPVEPRFDPAALLPPQAATLPERMVAPLSADPVSPLKPSHAMAESVLVGMANELAPADIADHARPAAVSASFGDALASAMEETQQPPPAELPPRSDAPDAAPAVSFMRTAAVVSPWHKTRVRVVLALVGVLLVVGLALQWVLHERDRIAAVQPQAHPWLALLCQPLGCRVQPLRHIDAMVIESSSFTKLRGDAYRLNLTLKNTAATALAMPALELTLTDLQDQAVVRRVFAPTELGASSAVLAPGVEWMASLPVSLRASNPPDRIAGYRVLVFYP